MAFKAPKGTQDILPNEAAIWQQVEKIIFEICKIFNFNEIRTPMFEFESLFNRSVGESTDIVEKEMFKFTDLAGRLMALRPEGTASVARAILEHGLFNEPLPIKLFYIISCFRNERPQAGRFKEFHQFGVELIGSTSPVSDVEIISLIDQFFKKLNLKNINLELNSIGCLKCRQNYRNQLISFYETHKNEICDICQNRLIKNPLRLLDCKNQNCKEIVKYAPKITEYICSNCLNHFNQICQLLDNEKIIYKINPFIVRGLDYYSQTVFEFQSNELGAQNTICGGGRYDTLFQTLADVNLPALGCSVGLERLLMLLKIQKNRITQISKNCIIFIGSFDSTISYAVSIGFKLRKLGLNAEINLLDRSVKSQMKYANKINANFCCIIGNNEIESNKIELKNMVTKQTHQLNLNNFVDEFLKYI